MKKEKMDQITLLITKDFFIVYINNIKYFKLSKINNLQEIKRFLNITDKQIKYEY